MGFGDYLLVLFGNWICRSFSLRSLSYLFTSWASILVYQLLIGPTRVALPIKEITAYKKLLGCIQNFMRWLSRLKTLSFVYNYAEYIYKSFYTVKILFQAIFLILASKILKMGALWLALFLSWKRLNKIIYIYQLSLRAEKHILFF